MDRLQVLHPADTQSSSTLRRTSINPFRSQNVVNLHTSRNINKARTIVNFDLVGRRHGVKTTHTSSEVVSQHLDVAVGALMLLSSTLSVL